MYVCMYVCMYIYIYIYYASPSTRGGLLAEAEVDDGAPTVGFQFQSSNFQFESLKSGQFHCGCSFDTMSDFNVPGSRP